MGAAKKLLALMLGSAVAVSALAACTPADEETPSGSTAEVYRICYDNLGDGYVDDAYTSVALDGITLVSAYNSSGRKVSDISSIAKYENGVVTGVSAGTVVYQAADGTQSYIEVVPAYVTDPGSSFYYTGFSSDFNELNSTVLGHTHDPSIIEAVDSTGTPVYYIFSTGWADQTTIPRYWEILSVRTAMPSMYRMTE